MMTILTDEVCGWELPAQVAPPRRWHAVAGAKPRRDIVDAMLEFLSGKLLKPLIQRQHLSNRVTTRPESLLTRTGKP